MGKTTGQIAGAVGAAATNWDEEPELQAFGNLATEALSNVSLRRNHMLHARPATTENGDQMLLRDRWQQNGQRDLCSSPTAAVARLLVLNVPLPTSLPVEH